MRKLGEQWIEIIDGERHMMKAVKGPCERCCVSHLCNLSSDCPMDWGLVAKDLGILKDGMLQCPFCGEYTEVLKGKLGYRIRHVCRDSYVMAGTGIYETKQQAIDAWNRRV